MSSEGDFHIPGNVTERNLWVPLPLALKTNQQARLGEVALSQIPAAEERRKDRHPICSKANSPAPPPCQALGKSFYRQSGGEGVVGLTCRNSTVISNLSLVV